MHKFKARLHKNKYLTILQQ